MTVYLAEESLAFVGNFFQEQGLRGYEAVALFASRVAEPEVEAWCNVVILPRQVAYRGVDGVSVHVPDDEVHDLYGVLGTRQSYLRVKFHTHPGRAYHSSADDANMLMRFRGGVSIVIPDFAQRRGIMADVRHWSVNVFDEVGGRWMKDLESSGVVEVRRRPADLMIAHIDRARQ